MASERALIVGGSSGIGKATARLLLEKGIAVTIIGRNAQKLSETAADLRESVPGAAVEEIILDLANLEAVRKLTKRIEEDQPFDYLVNSAGIFSPKPFIEHSEEDYDAYHAINRATFFLTQAVAKGMIKVKRGSIVNVGSMWAKQAVKATPSSAYSMAKAGLHALTQHLAMELADSGIRVNAVSPAVVKTPIYGAFLPEDEVDKTLDSLNSFHPIGRYGTDAEVATAIGFLLDSKTSGWTTGTILDIDGGVMAGRN